MALLHAYAWIGFLLVFLLGLVLTLLYERARSLWPAVILHGLVNAGYCVFTWYIFGVGR